MKKFLSLLMGASGSSITGFWQWFVKNQSRIENSSSEGDAIVDELLAQLHQYNEHLFLELSTNLEIKELIITAEGNSEHFDSVRNLIAKSPDLKNWKFTAFKPASGFEFTINYEGVEYNPKTMWFLPLHNESDSAALGIRIGIPNFNETVHTHSELALEIILDSALGELAATQEIQYMETGALPVDPEEKGYIELIELQEYLDWKKSKKK